MRDVYCRNCKHSSVENESNTTEYCYHYNEYTGVSVKYGKMTLNVGGDCRLYEVRGKSFG